VDLSERRRTVQAGCNAQIWGQTQFSIYQSGTFNVQRSTLNFQWGDRKGAWKPRHGDRHDVQYTDQERSTNNIQLSTFNGVTERAHGGRDLGTDTMFGRSAVQIEGQARYLARAAGFLTHRN